MEHKECDILIVGSGPAGMVAGIYGARAGLKVIILEKIAPGGQVMTTGEIENYPGFMSITGAELSMKFNEHVESYGVETIYDEIQKFDFNRELKKIECHDHIIVAKVVILALGANPRKTNAVGEEKFVGSGVHFCALCDGSFYKDKDVVVVGGGNSAVEEVIYLSSIVKRITVVNVTADFNAQAVLVDKLKTLPNIKAVYHNSIVKEVVTNDTGLKIGGILICGVGKGDEYRNIECGGVFVAIGREPSTAWLKGIVKRDKYGYIKVDKKLQTSIEGVFAAGDCVPKHVRQIITACSDGAVAATHAAEYIKSVKKHV